MVNLVPLDKARHSGKGWLRPTGYTFAAGDALAPLSASEFANTVPAMPIGFIERGGHYFPVALMGLTKGTNVFRRAGGAMARRLRPSRFAHLPVLASPT